MSMMYGQANESPKNTQRMRNPKDNVVHIRVFHFVPVIVCRLINRLNENIDVETV